MIRCDTMSLAFRRGADAAADAQPSSLPPRSDAVPEGVASHFTLRGRPSGGVPMTPAACCAIAAASPDPRAVAPASWALRSLCEVSAADLLRLGASLLVFAALWWPFVLAGVVGAWRVFRKAGRPGWACLVPGYNAVEFLRVAKLPAWLAVLFVVPLVNVALFAAACVRVARAFRKGPRF